MISLRPITVTSTLGHTVALPAATPTYVPDAIVHIALGLGCIVCDEHGKFLNPFYAPAEEKPKDAPAASAAAEEEDLEDARAEMTAAREAIEEAPEDDALVADGPGDPDVRREQIRQAYDRVMKRGDRKMMRNNGTPKVGAISGELGWQVKLRELAKAIAPAE